MGKYNSKNLIIIGVYLLGFSVGILSHLYDIYIYGFLGYKFAPFVLNVYWTLLTLFDTTVIILLLTKFKIGVILATIVMITDILVNLGFGINYYFITKKFIMWGLFTQIPFGFFIFFTAKYLLKKQTLKEFISA
jgi:hypothetical protein